MPRPTRLLRAAVLAAVAIASRALAADLPPLLTDAPAPDDVPLVSSGKIASIYVDTPDVALVSKSGELLAADIERVTGKRPGVARDAASATVLIGVVGRSPAIDALIASGKLDAKDLAGKWESFVLQTVDGKLVIAGSDRRGAAYGVVELSEQLGVSPWYFWADVPARHRDAAVVRAGTYKSAPPAVKYRGIFINDEDWGLQPWAAKTFEPEFGNIGPKTYNKVFELLIRLKANYLWPAMHPCSKEFGAVPENVKAADDWGVVMGASHCEPVNRNNVWWHQDAKGEWRYDTNRDGVKAYWEEWAQKRGPYEAVWTIGMRGIHDSAMPGPKDIREQVKLIDQAIADQRDLFKHYVNPDITAVPQIFCPYKEALAHYRAGLNVPDDVTLVWADDNYGYVRQLSDPKEQARAGHSGVYYHASYLGAPRPYLWIDTTPPALIYEEMTRALAFGADRVWVLNVGDVKSIERASEFWIRLAFNPKRYGADPKTADPQTQFLREWASREFGPEFADQTAAIMNEYYRLGFARKPEMMSAGAFDPVNYDEADRRVEQYANLLGAANELHARIPRDRWDAFYELVMYPVGVSSLMNEAFLKSDLARLHALQSRPDAAQLAADADAAVQHVEEETARYNEKIAGGKWNHIVTRGGTNRKDVKWADIRWPEPPKVASTPVGAGIGVVVQGHAVPIGMTLGNSAGDVDLPLASAQVDPAWKPQTVDGIPAVVVPNGTGDTRNNGQGPKITYGVDLPAEATLNLFLQLNCPTADDDSLYVKVDDGKWKEWNDLYKEGAGWRWHNAGSFKLSAGKHTVTVAQREDGTIVGNARLTPRTNAASMADSYPSARNDELPVLDRRIPDARAFVDVFQTSPKPTEYQATASAPWVRLSEDHGIIGNGRRIWVALAPDAPAGAAATLTLKGGEGPDRTVKIRTAASTVASPFVELEGVVSIDAAHFTRNTSATGIAWTTMPHLGRTGNAVSALPANAASRADLAAVTKDPAVLEYDFDATTTGNVTLHTFALPTHHAHAGRGLRFAVSLNDAQPVIIDFDEEGGASGEAGGKWGRNVTRNTNEVQTPLTIATPGKQTLKIFYVDPGVTLDKLVLDCGGLKTSDFGPPETSTQR